MVRQLAELGSECPTLNDRGWRFSVGVGVDGGCGVGGIGSSSGDDYNGFDSDLEDEESEIVIDEKERRRKVRIITNT